MQQYQMYMYQLEVVPSFCAMQLSDPSTAVWNLCYRFPIFADKKRFPPLDFPIVTRKGKPSVADLFLFSYNLSRAAVTCRF